MTTLSRIRAARTTDTMPAPPPSSSPTIEGEREEAPASRVDSRRRDTLPAPPPEHHEHHDERKDGDTDEAPPSTEKTPFAVDQVS